MNNNVGNALQQVQSTVAKTPIVSGNIWISILLILVGGLVLYLMYRLRKVEADIHDLKNTQYTDTDAERICQNTLKKPNTWEYLRDRIYDLDDQELSEQQCQLDGQCIDNDNDENHDKLNVRSVQDCGGLGLGMFGNMFSGLPGMMGVRIGMPTFNNQNFTDPQHESSATTTATIEEIDPNENQNDQENLESDKVETDSAPAVQQVQTKSVRWEDLDSNNDKVDE